MKEVKEVNEVNEVNQGNEMSRLGITLSPRGAEGTRPLDNGK